MDFGKNFIKARHRKGIDQKDAATALDISAAFLSKVERDKSKPSIDLILKAADFYGVEPGFFLSDKEIDLEEALKSDKNKKFINDLGKMSENELQEKYSIELDGKELTENELKGIIAYLRSVRAMD
ncbi:helix-turn-helix domain-containing protein [Peribacillus simplex]|uniref:helix-turn-helix domain-containing protein n=1 Tax=Peribacillus simplex TaxID=1478 RepID=UPI00333607EB